MFFLMNNQDTLTEVEKSEAETHQSMSSVQTKFICLYGGGVHSYLSVSKKQKNISWHTEVM